MHSTIFKLPGHEPTEIVIISPLDLTTKQSLTSVHSSSVFGERKKVHGMPPLLLDVHGGPNGVDTTAWNNTMYS